MTKENIVVLDSKSLPQMETKWFIVSFSPTETGVHDKIYAFKKYIGHRELFNTDVHHIECFDKNVPAIGYEFLLKTNSKLYLEELKQHLTLKEIEKPANVEE